MSDFIKAAVIGHPIAHSKSPLIHNYWIRRYGLQGSYEAVDIAPDNLQAGIESLVTRGFAGFNVTIPHKEAILALCAEIDETAQRIGAVNTVVIKDSRLLGRNTDAFGFMENLKTTQAGFDFSKRPAVVLGAGGAARAIVHGLLEAGVPEIILTNRTREKAQEVALSCAAPQRVQVVPWEDRNACLTGAGLLVNTTALGMKGKEPLIIDLATLPVDALVSDIVYVPLMTDLLATAKSRGNPVVTGIGMLLHQARPAFAGWYGIMPEVTPDLETLVLA